MRIQWYAILTKHWKSHLPLEWFFLLQKWILCHPDRKSSKVKNWVNAIAIKSQWTFVREKLFSTSFWLKNHHDLNAYSKLLVHLFDLSTKIWIQEYRKHKTTWNIIETRATDLHAVSPFHFLLFVVVVILCSFLWEFLHVGVFVLLAAPSSAWVPKDRFASWSPGSGQMGGVAE